MPEEAELELFRHGVNCAAVLESLTSGWKLDAAGSTKAALKYRRGAGNIIIVNHDGRGWWDPNSQARGDVFNLVQHLDPALNFGQVRRVLRRYVGISPRFPTEVLEKSARAVDQTPEKRWAARPAMRPGDAAWTYLAMTRRIPGEVLQAASDADCVRLGAYGSAWFAHRSHGDVTHVDIRSSTFKGSLRGGRKSLFSFGNPVNPVQLVFLFEAPIDALSFVALEGIREDTFYLATSGGMGWETVDALERLLLRFRENGVVLASATDGNAAGDRYAAHHEALADSIAVAFNRFRPPEGMDWNDVLRGRGA